MNIGGKVEKNKEYFLNDLERKGWTTVPLYQSQLTSEQTDWLREYMVGDRNIDIARLDGHCVCFRREEDAFNFKLRWS